MNVPPSSESGQIEFRRFGPDVVAANLLLVVGGTACVVIAVGSLLGSLIARAFMSSQNGDPFLAAGIAFCVAACIATYWLRRACREIALGRRSGFGIVLVIALLIAILGLWSGLLAVSVMAGLAMVYPLVRLFGWGPPLFDVPVDADDEG